MADHALLNRHIYHKTTWYHQTSKISYGSCKKIHHRNQTYGQYLTALIEQAIFTATASASLQLTSQLKPNHICILQGPQNQTHIQSYKLSLTQEPKIIKHNYFGIQNRNY